ncbi:MAG: MauE/DoxX family redox-associated membrane protein [Bryobacteraceae bacterium]
MLRLRPLEFPAWQRRLSWLAAILLATLFLVSGIWKIAYTEEWAARIHELLVPASLSLPAALAFGIVETLAGVLILVPRFRRWGAVLAGLLLVSFAAYFAIHYQALKGAECACFPWVKRVVGPQFFAEDGLMLVLAAIAGRWARASGGLRSASVILGAVIVFAFVSYGVAAARHDGTRAPASITVDGRPYSIARGRFFLFFFHPECTHCQDAAKQMAQFHWHDTIVVAIPVDVPQYSPQFLAETGLKAVVSSDFDRLKAVFGYAGYPFGVAIEDGRERAPLPSFEDTEPAATLKQIGFIY